MHLLFAALLALTQPAPTPPPQIVALTQTVLDAANANDAAKLAGIFTKDARVIDEDSPFSWSGASAGVKWWHSVQRALAKRGGATLRVTALPFSEYRQDREGDDAYLIQPLTIAVTSNGNTKTELGAETYTFHKDDDGTWMISSATWTTRP